MPLALAPAVPLLRAAAWLPRDASLLLQPAALLPQRAGLLLRAAALLPRAAALRLRRPWRPSVLRAVSRRKQDTALSTK